MKVTLKVILEDPDITLEEYNAEALRRGMSNWRETLEAQLLEDFGHEEVTSVEIVGLE